MRTRRLVRINTEEIWREYSHAIGIGRAELADYLDGATNSSVLELDNPNLWSRPVGLAELRRQLGVEPAQSFRYLNAKQLSRLQGLARRNADSAPMDLHASVPALR